MSCQCCGHPGGQCGACGRLHRPSMPYGCEGCVDLDPYRIPGMEENRRMASPTGRIGSSEPNLQTTPIRTDFGRRIHDALLQMHAATNQDANVLAVGAEAAEELGLPGAGVYAGGPGKWHRVAETLTEFLTRRRCPYCNGVLPCRC